MTPTNQLDLFIDEYFKEPDKTRIQNISLLIPGHKGHFLIMDSRKLSVYRANLAFKPSASFSLAIYFSFDNKNRKGRLLANRIASTECFNDFVCQQDSRQLVYLKDQYKDQKEISEQVHTIIACLYPEVEFGNIEIKLKRLDNWMTIEEQGSA